MRSSPTASEALLWQALRRSALGVRFRRQVLLGSCIVDFFAPAANLVVEVDGSIHDTALRSASDALRDQALHLLGYRVLRLRAELVEHDLVAALALIEAALP